MEATLFGHRKGAFTGADQDRIGKIQDAEGGTLFLDEISSLPRSLQPKLLRLLEEKTYEPVGDHRERRADLRFIASTNEDLGMLSSSRAGSARIFFTASIFLPFASRRCASGGRISRSCCVIFSTRERPAATIPCAAWRSPTRRSVTWWKLIITGPATSARRNCWE